MRDLTVGVDLGKVSDATAIVVLEAVEGDTRGFDVPHLERLEPGMPYPRQVERLKALYEALKGIGNVELVVDQTGVGQPVVDMLLDANLPVTAVTITAGDSVTRNAGHYRVPKRDLVSAMQVVTQTGRLRVAAGSRLAPKLLDELLAFRVSVNDRGHDTYGNDPRQSPHDDLVLAMALAVWYAEMRGPVTTVIRLGSGLYRPSHWDV